MGIFSHSRRRSRGNLRRRGKGHSLGLEILEERRLLTGSPVQAFALNEAFGVSYADQIATFNLNTPANPGANYYLIGPGGGTVPFQFVDNGKELAVETDLTADTQKTWQLYEGTPPAAPTPPANPVSVSQGPNYYQVTNGLTGVRIPFAATNLAYTPAPVQGILYQDGTWTATGPNFLSQSALTMNVQFLEQGPLEDVIQVSYTFNRPDAVFNGVDYPAGTGHYTSTITVQAGQPSVQMTEDADLELSYSLNVYNGLDPTLARYRGHDSTSVANGYDSNGQQYQNSGANGIDAFVNLQYNTPQSFPRMAVWNPWISNSGWYWDLYNQNASGAGNLFGIYAGPASTALGAENSGVNVWTAPLAVTDLVTRADAAGNIYSLYQSGDDLWVVKTSATMQSGTPVDLGSGLLTPDLQVDANGNVSVVAYSRAQQQFVRFTQGASGNFVSSPINLGTSTTWQVTGTYAYHASSSAADFLLVNGQYNGQSGLLLFAQPSGTTGYSFQQFVPALSGPSEGEQQPSFTALADGQIALLYTDPGGYLEVAAIQPGALNFGGPIGPRGPLFYQYQLLNFGSAIDPRTGDICVADSQGRLDLLTPQGQQLAAQMVSTSLGLPLGYHQQGPNRRSIAADDSGDVLAVHNGQFYLYQNGAWGSFAAANQLNLTSARVLYDAATGEFVLAGQGNGMLTVYQWKAGQAAPTLAGQLAGTADPGAGITIAENRFSPDAHSFPEVRYSWGIYTGTVGAGLAPSDQVQPVAQQMDIHGGINLNLISRITTNYADPPQGYGGLFENPSTVQAMIQRLQTDPAYYNYIWNADPQSRPLIQMWANPTSANVNAVVNDILGQTQTLLNSLVNGDGIYDFQAHYWHGGLAMNTLGTWIDAVLADNVVTAQQKAQLKGVAGLFANILWDNDFVPMQDGTGLNLGTANMPVQQAGYRGFYALFLAQDPDMQPYVAGVEQSAAARLDAIVNQYGAEISASHYMLASMEPELNLLLQMQRLGDDVFQTDPRLTAFAQFYLNLLSPADPRFGGQRKVIAIGDSPTESSELYGLLATGFRQDNPTLAAQLQGAWVEDGSIQSSFFGTTLVKIDQNAPTAVPALADGNYPGYDSVLRDGSGTPDETALWLVDGDFYSDHRHYDQGSTVTYALGAPVSLNWAGQYTPQTYGGAMQNMVEPASQLPWGQSTMPLTAGGPWGSSALDAFSSFGDSAMAQATFTTGQTSWTRGAYSIHPEQGAPILMLQDSFQNATGPMVFSMNLMATGGVQTPAGTITPPPASYANGQLPSQGQIFTLQAGVNRLGFTGQWGVDFDVYVIAGGAEQAQIGSYTENWTNGNEENQFQAATGQPYQETQDTLRILGSGPFTTLILPYVHGQRPPDLNVSQSGGNLVVTENGTATTVGSNFYASQGGGQSILTTYDSAPAAALNMNVSGGPLEAVMTSGRVALTATGPAGTRAITLPGNWTVDPANPNPALTFGNGQWYLNYQGGAPLTVDLVPMTPPPSAVAQPSDPGFETPGVGTGGGAYRYNPAGAPWTYSAQSGVAGNGSGFTAGNPNAPQGTQVGFLQQTGTISQAVNFSAGSYTISFDAAQRQNYQASYQAFAVEVDGAVVGTFRPGGTAYAAYTTGAFTVTAGSHTVSFVGLDPNGGDNTAFIDQVSIATATSPTAGPTP